MSYPKTKTCIECGNPFTTVADVDTCMQCLLKPSPKPKGEGIMAHNLKNKICTECGNPYKPTGPCQKRCPDCLVGYNKKRQAPEKMVTIDQAVEQSKIIKRTYHRKASSLPTIVPIALPQTKPAGESDSICFLRKLLTSLGAIKITVDAGDCEIVLNQKETA